MTGVCPLCGRRVSLGARNRILAHNVHLLGLGGRTVLNQSCAGRGLSGIDASGAPPDAAEPVQLPAVLKR